MKTLWYCFKRVALIGSYLIISMLATGNIWLSIILTILLVKTFGNAKSILSLTGVMEKGVVGAFEENDEHHNQHTQEIESLKEQVESLEEQIKTLEERVEELQHPYNKEIL